jgi:Na+-translocating ferredoxin:NAD+ oxidoreductase RnfC subunit
VLSFPLSQHIGAPAKAVVQRGDTDKVATLIAEAGGFVSAPIFASVSGKVTKSTGPSTPPATVSLPSSSR